MKHGALPFDDIPVIRRRIGRQHFCGTRFEVGNDGIHWHAGPGDHDAGLAAGAKIRRHATLPERPCDRQRGVFLAQRAVCTDGKQAPAAALAACRDGNVARRRTHIDQPPVVTLGRRNECRHVREFRMHAGDEIEASFQCRQQRRHPAVEDATALIRHADDHRSRALRLRLRRRELRQADADRVRRTRQFADAFVARPVAQTEGRLGKTGLRRVAEEQQVGLRQIQHCRLLRRRGERHARTPRHS